MFVKSKMSIPVKYYKGADCIVLKPNTVTFVEDTKVTPKELKDCYGGRIDIIAGADVTPVMGDSVMDVKLEDRKGDITLNSINDILAEISLDEDIPEISLDEDIPEISNTGDKDVDDFLNGKTEKLPEGTEIISEGGAKELEKNAKEIKKDAKTKVTRASKSKVSDKKSNKNK